MSRKAITLGQIWRIPSRFAVRFLKTRDCVRVVAHAILCAVLLNKGVLP